MPTDLSVLGMEACDPAVLLDGFVQDGVDLSRVTRCLDLLRANAVVLHCGMPRALMVYSPATGCYSASFDGGLDDDLASLTEAQAGLWLAGLASEQGELPDRIDHWCVISVAGRRLSGRDLSAIETYQASADRLDVYDRAISRAFWALATRCQAGR